MFAIYRLYISVFICSDVHENSVYMSGKKAILLYLCGIQMSSKRQ